MHYADFSHANIDGANFSKADLLGANLHNVDERRATFTKAKMKQIKRTDSALLKAETWQPPTTASNS